MKPQKKVNKSEENHISHKNSEIRENYLTDYSSFYGDELKILHAEAFIEQRLENHEQEILENRVFDKIESFIEGPNDFLILCGESGAGKSRSIIELAKKDQRIKFINWTKFRENLDFLKEGLNYLPKKGCSLSLTSTRNFLVCLNSFWTFSS